MKLALKSGPNIELSSESGSARSNTISGASSVKAGRSLKMRKENTVERNVRRGSSNVESGILSALEARLDPDENELSGEDADVDIR